MTEASNETISDEKREVLDTDQVDDDVSNREAMNVEKTTIKESRDSNKGVDSDVIGNQSEESEFMQQGATISVKDSTESAMKTTKTYLVDKPDERYPKIDHLPMTCKSESAKANSIDQKGEKASVRGSTEPKESCLKHDVEQRTKRVGNKQNCIRNKSLDLSGNCHLLEVKEDRPDRASRSSVKGHFELANASLTCANLSKRAVMRLCRQNSTSKDTSNGGNSSIEAKPCARLERKKSSERVAVKARVTSETRGRVSCSLNEDTSNGGPFSNSCMEGKSCTRLERRKSSERVAVKARVTSETRGRVSCSLDEDTSNGGSFNNSSMEGKSCARLERRKSSERVAVKARVTSETRGKVSCSLDEDTSNGGSFSNSCMEGKSCARLERKRSCERVAVKARVTSETRGRVSCSLDDDLSNGGNSSIEGKPFARLERRKSSERVAVKARVASDTRGKVHCSLDDGHSEGKSGAQGGTSNPPLKKPSSSNGRISNKVGVEEKPKNAAESFSSKGRRTSEPHGRRSSSSCVRKKPDPCEKKRGVALSYVFRESTSCPPRDCKATSSNGTTGSHKKNRVSEPAETETDGVATKSKKTGVLTSRNYVSNKVGEALSAFRKASEALYSNRRNKI